MSLLGDVSYVFFGFKGLFDNDSVVNVNIIMVDGA
jgi:hypothetical protein